ncbi:MAG: DUF3106 domain-containing protein [Phycisphaerae bacterium]
MRNVLKILAAAIIPLVLAATAAAEADDSAALRKPPMGSIAAQLRIKAKLKAQQEGTTLADAINHNRAEWEGLSPDQREDYRNKVYAFLKESPEKQEELLKHYDELIHMSAAKRQQYEERAKWLQAVIDSMTTDERKMLLDMTPENQARVLVERRDKMIREGKLPGPTSKPTSAPSTTAPAPKGSQGS